MSSLASQEQTVGDPFFSILEILIILTMPLMVALMACVHVWASPESKAYSLTALVFMGLTAGLTSSVHFVILTLGHQPAFSALSWLPLFLSFKWPSVVYALDILAWDVFFAVSVLFAAQAFRGSKLATSIRMLMIVSGVLAIAGLSGVVAGDMRLRFVGVIGYAGVFPIAALLVAIHFRRAQEPRLA